MGQGFLDEGGDTGGEKTRRQVLNNSYLGDM